jgi:hypothetical protein
MSMIPVGPASGSTQVSVIDFATTAIMRTAGAPSTRPSLSFEGPSGSYREADDFKTWMLSSKEGDVFLSNVSILPPGELSKNSEGGVKLEWTGPRYLSAKEQKNLAKSLDNPDVLSWASNKVSLAERDEMLNSLLNESMKQKPNVEVILDNPNDPVWQDLDAVTLFHLSVKGDAKADKPVRSYYRAIPVKQGHISGQVKDLRTSLGYSCSHGESVKESDCKEVRVDSFLGPALNDLEKNIKKREGHVRAASRRVARIRASASSSRKGRKDRESKGKGKATASPKEPQELAEAEEALADAQKDVDTFQQIHRAVKKQFPVKK